MARKIKGALIFTGQPSAPYEEEGTLYYNSTDNQFEIYNGSDWEVL